MADVSDEVLKAILNKLDNLEDNVNGMKLDMNKRFDKVNDKFDDIDARFEVVDANILEVKALATRTALELENNVIPKLQIVTEQHGSIIEKLDTMNKKLDKTMNTVDMQEMRLNIYSLDLKDIKNKLETA